MSITLLLPSVYALACAAAAPATQPAVEYVSDVPHRILYTQQGWGKLGMNTCAVERGGKPQPLRIGEKQYEKGLGHHSPGEIIIDLGGEYERFEAEVGLQPLPDTNGSVEFQVFVDDEKKFDSGVMRTADRPRSVSVPLAGAMELRLAVTDGGDGIVSDCANWAEARLVRAGKTANPSKKMGLNVAQWGRLLVSDPKRKEGAHAKRIEEFRAEDVFLESTFQSAREDGDELTASHALGINWYQRRLLRSVGIEFMGDTPPAAPALQAECWVGESLWQGGWKPLGGEWRETDGGWELLIDWSKTPEARSGTRKIRWLVSNSTTEYSVKPGGLTAISATPLATVDLRLELKDAPASKVIVMIADGRFVGENHGRIVWDAGQPLAIQVEYAKARPWRSDRTVLHFYIEKQSFAVAVDDVLSKGAVYVRDAGLFISRGDMNRDMEGYLASIKDKKTILQEVRELPDQTFAQAIEKVHNPKQDLQPMLLSLACDNHKFVVQRDGTIQFASAPDAAGQMLLHQLKYSGQITPKFGSGKNEKLSRRLAGGWLPAPITRVEEDGIVYEQRTFVVPMDEKRHPDAGGWLSREQVCIVEFTMANTTAKEAPAELAIKIVADAAKSDVAEFKPLSPGGWFAFRDGRLIAVIGEEGAPGPEPEFNSAEGSITFKQKLPPGGAKVIRAHLPTHSISTDQMAKGIELPEGTRNIPVAESWRETEAYWNDVMRPVMQIELPDKLLTNVIRASQVHCLLAARNEKEGERIAPWIASFVYGPLESESNSIIRGMDAWGHHEFARRSLDFFINKYDPAGFLTTGYTLMGTGWHLWSLGEHYQLTRDDAWMKSVAPKVVKVCEWITKQRQKTMRRMGDHPGVDEYGLMPPGVMADWNAFAYYFCLNGYYYKGLLEAARALDGIGDKDGETFLKDAAEFREDILRAYHLTQARMPVYPLRDGTSVPGYPSQLTAPGPSNNFFPGEDANRSWCYDVELGAHQLVPQGVLDPKSRDVADMMDHMEDVQFLAEGWFDYPAERNQKDPFNLGGFAKVQPYYCRNIEVDALRDDVKPFIRSYFNTIPSLLGMETLSFQEHFNGVAAWNKTHETGYFLYYSRLMLVQERGDDLWLAPFVTNNWLKEGMEIKVKNAPTRFGPVGYRIKSAVAGGRIEAEIDPPHRTPPQRIVLRLRHPDGKSGTIGEVTGVARESVAVEKEQIGRETSNRVVISMPGAAAIKIVMVYE